MDPVQGFKNALDQGMVRRHWAPLTRASTQRKGLLEAPDKLNFQGQAEVRLVDNMKQAQLSISLLLSIPQSIAYAHVHEAIYIIGSTIFLLQGIFMALTLWIKLPRYSLASLLSIPVSWMLVYLITDNFINIEPKSNLASFLLMTPGYILVLAKLRSIQLKKKSSP